MYAKTQSLLYKQIKYLINNTLEPFGLRLTRLPKVSDGLSEFEKEQYKWLIEKNIKTVLDIGANTGQFALFINRLFSQANIYSFEPIPDCYEKLVRNFIGRPNFKAFNIAIGKEKGTAMMNINGFSEASSFLDLTSKAKTYYPFAVDVDKVREVEVDCLDNVYMNLEICEPILIKVDVQGFEDHVLSGGRETFERATIAIIEMSVEELYEGQVLFDGIYQKLKEYGFTYRGNFTQAYSPIDNRVVFFDGVFMK